MALVTVPWQCELNHSVDVFTAHGIVDRRIQTALDGPMAGVYPSGHRPSRCNPW